MSKPSDPAAFFRDMIGQWEKMAKGFGPDAAKPDDMAAGMQAAYRDAMEQALSAANLPTRTDIAALSQRIDTIEAALARIEAALAVKKDKGGARKRASDGD